MAVSNLHTLVAIMGVPAVLASCNPGRSGAWERTSTDVALESAAKKDQRELMSAAAEAWDQRVEKHHALAAIAAWEEAAETNPANVDALIHLSRGYHYYADCFLRFDPQKQADYKSAHDQGARAAEKALSAISPEFAERMRSGERIDQAVAFLSPRGAPALYWRAANLDRWAEADGLATVLAYRDEGRAAMEFCLENDRDYFYGGPDRYLGAFFASSPRFVGGDMDRSRDHFEASLTSHPNYLATRTLYAADWAVKENDRTLFEELLTANVNADPASMPEVCAENLCEQRKSRALLDRTEELF